MSYYSYGGRFGWYVAADMSHEHYEGDLFEIGALPGGVRTGQNFHEALLVAGVSVIRDKRC